jgi:hypothetical protein
MLCNYGRLFLLTFFKMKRGSIDSDDRRGDLFLNVNGPFMRLYGLEMKTDLHKFWIKTAQVRTQKQTV